MPWRRRRPFVVPGDDRLKVTVVGAGTMGNGIAQVFAQNGNEVILVDSFPAALDKARMTMRSSLEKLKLKGAIQEDPSIILQRIHTMPLVETSSRSDIYIEAVPERLDIKKEVIESISAVAKEDAICATNTSSISINLLSGFYKAPDNFIGIHFFNPVPVMRLVEIVRSNRTSEYTLQKAMDLVSLLGKESVISNDYPGFISNRLLMPLLREAMEALEQGVASKEDIDKTMRLGMNHPMGPLELSDFIGLDVTEDIMDVLYREFGDSRYKPPIVLRNLVNSGKLGRKSGEGFYKY